MTRSLNLKREIAGYCWQRDTGGQLTDKPAKILDHGMDAMRYGAYTWHIKGGDIKMSYMDVIFG